MTALAGAVGERSPHILEALCTGSLARQHHFGRTPPAIQGISGAAFGLSLFETVPQDAFDRQPLTAGPYMLVADVRLDNREDLLLSLNRSLTDFRQQSDAAILFEGLRAWGHAALERLLGGYAFAFYDARERSVLLARDPAGEKPLHYAWRNQLFCFASMPSGLIDSQGPQFDLETLAWRLARPAPLLGRSSFEGIRSVRPGHMLLVSGSASREADFWQPSLGPHRASDPCIVEAFREHLDAAVAARLRTSSPAIASQLSSGYDSSAVTTTAARLAEKQKVVAITAAPAPGLAQLMPMNRIADESGFAALTAARHGLEHVVVHDSASLLAPLAAGAAHFQEPVGNVLNIGWWLKALEAARARDASVLLCGIMGNFTLSYGGMAVLPHLVGNGHWRWWLREARAVVAKNRNRWRGVLMASFEPQLPTAMAAAIRRKTLRAPPPDRYSFTRSHWTERVPAAATGRSSDLHRTQFDGLRQFDPGVSNKSLLALTGVDQRDPTSDRRFTEFCLSLPPDQLLRDGVFRPLARQGLTDRVPEEVLGLSVRGYQAADWFARLHRAEVELLIEDICASHSANELLDLGKMRQAVANWPSPDRDNHESIFAFGRALTNALATGKFIADIERNPSQLLG